MAGSASDFDVAKSVTELLEKLERGRQELVLRWVRESLHLDPVLPSSPSRDRQLPSASSTVESEHVVDTGDSDAHPVDIKSFVDEKQPKSDMQFSAVVAYYYRFVAPSDQRREVIDGEALREASRQAGRNRPPKPHMTLINAKNQGYLDKVGRGEFKLNTVGENLVAMTLPGEEGVARLPARRRRVTKPSSPPKRKARAGSKTKGKR